ncbi:Suppression of tumorigenicity 5 protein [Nymphon striatum]|nr:Suppression of tumorigenicity 5 protein [Nymphon striatum]
MNLCTTFVKPRCVDGTPWSEDITLSKASSDPGNTFFNPTFRCPRMTLHSRRLLHPTHPYLTQKWCKDHFSRFWDKKIGFLKSRHQSNDVLAKFYRGVAALKEALFETYSFVLTDDKGVQTFAYCKRTLPPSQDPCTPIVYCLVCTERDFHFYKKLLENRLNQINAPSNSFLEELYDRNLPKPGEVFYCPESLKGDEEVSIQRSADAQTESVEFSHLLKALHVETLIKAFSVILMERRILFCANTLTVLTQCVQGLAALLYPFTWQHTLVPVIPETMLDLCSLPAPFVMGVLTNSIDKVKELPLEDVLIVDLDYSRIIQETVDINATIIPRKIRAALSTALTLANSMTDPTAMYLTTVMSETFVRMFVHLVGHYENHIIVNQDGDLHFERDSFCKAPYSRGIQMFLKWFCETQTFDVFINKRLNTTALHMKKRRDFDLFERRCEEHRLDMEQLSQTFKGNFREIGKKVKDFSEFVINCYQYLVLF